MVSWYFVIVKIVNYCRKGKVQNSQNRYILQFCRETLCKQILTKI